MPTGNVGEPFDEHRVAKLVRPVVVSAQFLVYAGEGLVIDERSQQFVVTRAWLVRPRKHGIDDVESRGSADPVGRQS
jgi:hypothetical protein